MASESNRVYEIYIITELKKRVSEEQQKGRDSLTVNRYSRTSSERSARPERGESFVSDLPRIELLKESER